MAVEVLFVQEVISKKSKSKKFIFRDMIFPMTCEDHLSSQPHLHLHAGASVARVITSLQSLII